MSAKSLHFGQAGALEDVMRNDYSPPNRHVGLVACIVAFGFIFVPLGAYAEPQGGTPPFSSPPSFGSAELPTTRPISQGKAAPTEDAIQTLLSYRLRVPVQDPRVYDVVLENYSAFDISELFLVGLTEPVKPDQKDLTNPQPYVVRLSSPESGGQLTHSITYSSNRANPILYVAVFSPQLPDPLWVRVSPASEPAKAVSDPATVQLEMADRIAAAGNKAAAAERYKKIIADYPDTTAAKTAQQRLGWSDEQVASVQKSGPKLTPKIYGVELANAARGIVVERERQQAALEADRRARVEADARAQRARLEAEARAEKEQAERRTALALPKGKEERRRLALTYIELFSREKELSAEIQRLDQRNDSIQASIDKASGVRDLQVMDLVTKMMREQGENQKRIYDLIDQRSKIEQQRTPIWSDLFSIPREVIIPELDEMFTDNSLLMPQQHGSLELKTQLEDAWYRAQRNNGTKR